METGEIFCHDCREWRPRAAGEDDYYCLNCQVEQMARAGMGTNEREPDPSFTKTYHRADGEHVADYAWVTDLEFFEDDDYPVELVEETWERTAVRVFWHLPAVLFDCDLSECDEDAVSWEQQPDGEWRRLCAAHQTSNENAGRASAAPSEGTPGAAPPGAS